MSAATDNKGRIANVDATLTSVIGQLETEANVKKAIRESLEPIEEFSRSALTELNKLHSAPASDQAAICERCLATVAKAQPLWADVSKLIPKGEFYRYSFAIGPLCRSFVTSIAFARFILHDELVPAFTAANLMGLGGDDTGELQLTADDYLQGVIGMVNELPRLSINAVTAQNFALPVKIAAFVNDVFQSYSLLNLRNDQLRRRFDSLKYDLKRCEDVVYDLTLRGLTAGTAAEANGEKTNA
ncbi:Translin [Dioszegia hungarica]|uniref:Translin n=1 Tax=Dioszegia hungarica TaxID=4972 RepID=A0AA38LWG0_9TREE|nr:Translin [Dioszegia hungarica]KAI9637708.1 Translin [Dioszegia hungarica]